MTSRLRQLMLEFNFGCEAEIYASDLRYKMFESFTFGYGSNNFRPLKLVKKFYSSFEYFTVCFYLLKIA